jgi:putative endonuclease
MVAERERVVVFVEVKARRSNRRGLAAESIPLWKRRRIGAMALDYLAWSGRPHARCRFDVVAIDGLGTSSQTIRVIEGAFDWK